MSEITYGPKGTQIIVVEGAKADEEGNLTEGGRTDTAYFMGYEDATGTFFLWHVPANEVSVVTDIDEELQRGALKQEIVNTLPNTKVSLNQFNNLSIGGQIVSAGSYSELKSDLVDISPVQSFIEDMSIIADELYWWKDSEYLNIVQENFAETGSYELNPAQMAEFLTKYNLSKEAYNGAIERATNPIGYKNKKAEYFNAVKTQATTLGGEISDKAAEYIAKNWASGTWSATKSSNQVVALLDPFFKIDKDPKLVELAGDVTPISTGETKVQSLLNTYIPKHMHNQIDIAEIAGNIRNIGGYEDTFIEELKDMRMVQYGMYDRDVKWQNILNTYKSQAADLWGITPADDDVAILDAIKLNNQTQSRSDLKRIGLERGYQKTVNDFATGLSDAFGTGIARSAGYLEG